MVPCSSTPMMSRTPLDRRILMVAVPAAPTPVTTTRSFLRSFFTIRSALSSAASTTTAVPCWSSWKTGMSSSLRSRSSISKQRGAAGDGGHGVLLDRERERPVPVLLDRQAHARHARCVGHREVVTGANRHLALDLDLDNQVHQEGPVRDVDDADPRHLLEPVDDLRAVDAVPRVDGDVADDVVTARLDQVHGADIATGVTDGHGDAAQHAGPILYCHADGEAITGARRDCGHSSLLPSPAERSQLDAATSPMAGNPNPGDEGSFMARGGWTSAAFML